jgi:hypothetical protein
MALAAGEADGADYAGGVSAAGEADGELAASDVESPDEEEVAAVGETDGELPDDVKRTIAMGNS